MRMKRLDECEIHEWLTRLNSDFHRAVTKRLLCDSWLSLFSFLSLVMQFVRRIHVRRCMVLH